MFNPTILLTAVTFWIKIKLLLTTKFYYKIRNVSKKMDQGAEVFINFINRQLQLARLVSYRN